MVREGGRDGRREGGVEYLTSKAQAASLRTLGCEMRVSFCLYVATHPPPKKVLCGHSFQVQSACREGTTTVNSCIPVSTCLPNTTTAFTVGQHTLSNAPDNTDERFNSEDHSLRVDFVCLSGPSWEKRGTAICRETWDCLHDNHLDNWPAIELQVLQDSFFCSGA